MDITEDKDDMGEGVGTESLNEGVIVSARTTVQANSVLLRTGVRLLLTFRVYVLHGQ